MSLLPGGIELIIKVGSKHILLETWWAIPFHIWAHVARKFVFLLVKLLLMNFGLTEGFWYFANFQDAALFYFVDVLFIQLL